MNVLLRASHVLPLRVGILAAAAAVGALVSLVPGFQAVGLGAVLAACAALAWLMVRFRHDVNRQQLASETLMSVRRTLEAQVEARTADARDSDARLRSVIDSAVDGIIVIDEKGLVESCNPAVERLFGYPSIDVVGRNISMLMPAPYHEEHDALSTALRRHRDRPHHWHWTGSEGAAARRHCLSTAPLGRRDVRCGASAVHRDPS